VGLSCGARLSHDTARRFHFRNDCVTTAGNPTSKTWQAFPPPLGEENFSGAISSIC